MSEETIKIEQPYQVCLYCGDAPPKIKGVAVFDITPDSLDPDETLKKIEASGISTTDLRARAVFTTDGDVQKALMTYAALIGYVGRRLDIAIGENIISASDLHKAAQKAPDVGKPDPVPTHVQISEGTHPEILTINFGKQFTKEDASNVRYAKRARLVPSDATVKALTQFLFVGGLRCHIKDNDRLPYLCDGTEQAPTAETVSEPVGICLDTLRRNGAALRKKETEVGNRATTKKVDLSERQTRLYNAAGQPMKDVMNMLGGRLNEDKDLWHCPRPQRHTNGDANPSMKINGNKVRCYRCDPEWIDPLRLTMDVQDATADEAAEHLLSNLNELKEPISALLTVEA